eukprot:CAMPEP_0179454664 /NCGR_PEP_ID=MMETSP0799-20121207/38562_1 /TAXON_ID=46947 /ORGANISM="Geminigera cryophila, Strain CCMP2564" /LENGTH=43 /DNA_ID= /DNA_START= /DNA_END= /DNA_ORIENTATION=
MTIQITTCRVLVTHHSNNDIEEHDPYYQHVCRKEEACPFVNAA